jgi:hypothetical protein
MLQRKSSRSADDCGLGTGLVTDQKVGGTGRWARSREIKKKGGKMGDYSESAGMNDSSGQQSRGLRAFSDVSQFAVQQRSHCGQV